MLWLQSDAIGTITSNIGAGIVTVAVAIKGLYDHRTNQRRDETAEEQIGQIRIDIRDLKAFVVGPDGENGIRADVREIKKRVIGLEDRERERLQAGPPIQMRDVGTFQPPRGSSL